MGERRPRSLRHPVIHTGQASPPQRRLEAVEHAVEPVREGLRLQRRDVHRVYLPRPGVEVGLARHASWQAWIEAARSCVVPERATAVCHADSLVAEPIACAISSDPAYAATMAEGPAVRKVAMVRSL